MDKYILLSSNGYPFLITGSSLSRHSLLGMSMPSSFVFLCSLKMVFISFFRSLSLQREKPVRKKEKSAGKREKNNAKERGGIEIVIKTVKGTETEIEIETGTEIGTETETEGMGLNLIINWIFGNQKLACYRVNPNINVAMLISFIKYRFLALNFSTFAENYYLQLPSLDLLKEVFQRIIMYSAFFINIFNFILIYAHRCIYSSNGF